MAGNANSGRNRLSVAEKKLKGTFRADRDKKQEKAENTVCNTIAFPKDTIIAPPCHLPPDIQSLYCQHAQSLISLGLLTPSDLPELAMLYDTLLQYREVNEALKGVDILDDLMTYQMLTNLKCKLQQQFTSLAARYYISPTARAKLTLDVLEIDKKQNENAITRILARKKQG